MLFKLRNSIGNSLVRSTIILQIGSVGAMLVQAVAGVVLARLLGPHEFGRFAIVMSMAAIGSVFLGAGAADAMAPVLARAHHAGDGKGVRDSILFLGKFVVATSLLVCAVGFLTPIIAGSLYHDSILGWLAFAVMGASAISTMLFAPTQLSLQVFGRIGALSALTFADQTVRQTAVVALVLTGLGIAGAAFGHLIGALIIVLVSAGFWWWLRSAWPLMPSISSLWGSFPDDGRRYVRPTLWVLADRNLAMLYGAAPIAVAALFLAASDISYFKIALGWVTLALSVLSPVSILLNTEFARIQVQQSTMLRIRFLQITGAALGASTIVTLGAALLARSIFGMLYGVEYIPAVGLVWQLVPFGALFGLGIALGPMWRAIDRVRVSILINSVVLIIGIPLALGALRAWGSLGAVVMVTGWYTTSHVISFWYLFRVLGTMKKHE